MPQDSREILSPEARKAILARKVEELEAKGWTVQSHNGFTVLLVKPRELPCFVTLIGCLLVIPLLAYMLWEDFRNSVNIFMLELTVDEYGAITWRSNS